MIKHIVMWKLKDEVNGVPKTQLVLQLKERLEGLVPLIPEIQYLEVGLNFKESPAAKDVALYTKFNSMDDLQTYQDHPDHQEVAAFLKDIVEERAVVDYQE